MRSSRLLLAAVPAVGLAALVAACTEGPAADVGLVMLAPEGLLGDATSVKLSVFDAKSGNCDPATGDAGTPPSNAQAFQLKKDGCDAGTWCGQITLDKNGAKKIFAVEVRNDASLLLGQGCNTAVINQDPLDVSIKVVRYVAPACCGDGALQPGELCDPGGSPSCGGVTAGEVCLADCTAAELPVDRKPGDPAPAPGDAKNASIAFVGGNGQLANGLRVGFEAAAAGGSDIAIDFRQNDLSHITSPALLNGPLRIPLKCSNPGAAGQARRQVTPSVATLDPMTSLVVFASDLVDGINFNLYYTTLGADGCAGGDPLQANTTANGVSEPRVATGPSGSALLVWTQNGAIQGRVLAGGVLGTEFTVAQGKTARVAGNANGWVVVYEGTGAGDDDGIFLKKVSATGTVGSETLVNAKTAGVQDQPDVGLLSDGRALVAFHDGGDVYFQRFDATGAPVSGDQSAAIHLSLDGEQANPAVAPGTGDYFAVAWENQATGEIAARYVGGSSGFLFNPVDGQNSDFVASAAGVAGARRKPTVAVGGDGYVAMAWEDQSASHTGVFLRRFPLPM